MGEVLINLFFPYSQDPGNVLCGILIFPQHLGYFAADGQSIPPGLNARTVHAKRESIQQSLFCPRAST
jgi:hypothetical protein